MGLFFYEGDVGGQTGRHRDVEMANWKQDIGGPWEGLPESE